MMRMEKVNDITVPSTSSFSFKPGGHHLMLMGLHQPLREGDKVTIELSTEEGDTVSTELTVRSVLKE